MKKINKIENFINLISLEIENYKGISVLFTDMGFGFVALGFYIRDDIYSSYKRFVLFCLFRRNIQDEYLEKLSINHSIFTDTEKNFRVTIHINFKNLDIQKLHFF